MAGLPSVWGRDGRAAQRRPDEHVWRGGKRALQQVQVREKWSGLIQIFIQSHSLVSQDQNFFFKGEQYAFTRSSNR